MSGRRSLLETFIQQGGSEERFRFVIEQIEKKKITVEAAAKIFNCDPKTITRNIAYLKDKDRKILTAAPASKWEDMPEAKEWETRIRVRMKPTTAQNVINHAKKIWSLDFQNKPLSALNEQDFIRAATRIKNEKTNAYTRISVLRYLVKQGGFGKQEWLSQHLEVGKLAPKPRIPAELTDEKTLKEFLPRILSRLDSLLGRQVQVGSSTYTIDQETIHVLSLIVLIKATTGIRTGDRKEERELWGTRIGVGKSVINLAPDGRLLSWVVFAKKGEIWTIYPFTCTATSEIEAYIREKNLQTGDYLLPGDRIPVWKEDHLANAVFKLAVKEEGFKSYMDLHTLRKVWGTGLKLAGVPLEDAAELNVGWKNVNVLRSFYQMVKGSNAAEAYRKFENYMELGGLRHETADPRKPKSAEPLTVEAPPN